MIERARLTHELGAGRPGAIRWRAETGGRAAHRLAARWAQFVRELVGFADAPKRPANEPKTGAELGPSHFRRPSRRSPEPLQGSGERRRQEAGLGLGAQLWPWPCSGPCRCRSCCLLSADGLLRPPARPAPISAAAIGGDF